jgi:hypothetical protein
MIQGHDYEILHRMLGTERFSPELVAEYSLRIRMLHACGGGVSLGAVGLVDLCRSVGLSIDAKPVSLEPTDWREVKIDSPVMVLHHGNTTVGMYRGQTAPGRISVAFDGDEWVHEFPASSVSLVGEDDLTKAFKAEVVDADPVPAVLADANTADDVEVDGGVKWGAIPGGTPIEMLAGDEIVSGEFISLAEQKGCLAVEVAGKRLVVLAEDVVLQSAMEDASAGV